MLNKKDRILCSCISLMMGKFFNSDERKLMKYFFSHDEIVERANIVPKYPNTPIGDYESSRADINTPDMNNVTIGIGASNEEKFFVKEKNSSLSEYYRLASNSSEEIVNTSYYNLIGDLADVINSIVLKFDGHGCDEQSIKAMLDEYYMLVSQREALPQESDNSIGTREAVWIAAATLTYNEYTRSGSTNIGNYLFSPATIANLATTYNVNNSKESCNTYAGSGCVRGRNNQSYSYLIAAGDKRRLAHFDEDTVVYPSDSLHENFKVNTIDGIKSVGEIVAFVTDIYTPMMIEEVKKENMKKVTKSDVMMLSWTDFYESFATELLKYKNDRALLIEKIKKVFENIDMKMPKFERDDTIIDIDPFTIFAHFNKGITDKNRIAIISEIAKEFNIAAKVPSDFDGIPLVNNMAVNFFRFKENRKENDIDNLWNVFEAAIAYADQNNDSGNIEDFITAYEKVIEQAGIKWNLSMGLFWIRPFDFLNLDGRNRWFISDDRNMPASFVELLGEFKNVPNGMEYIHIVAECKKALESGKYPYTSLPELSSYAWKKSEEANKQIKEEQEAYVLEDGAISSLYDGISTEKRISYVFNTGFESNWERNRIVFGAPGTGKSFTINKEKNDLLGSDIDNYERVTFHPDYSYASFVGTYKPVPSVDADGKDTITYEYVPGPFMRTLVKALKNSTADDVKPFLLIIEEINRANVAAVFGDVFQLLDRDDDGVSEYPIHASEDVKKYLTKELGGTIDDYDEIRLPDNMFIWASMNSADQGVFPMDTAFKRRWDFTYIGINASEAEIVGKTVTLGLGSYKCDVEWNELRKAINSELLSFKVNEDKLMGPYFISKKVLGEGQVIDSKGFTRVFKNKVLMYLFDDAAKQKRASLFAGCTEKNLYSSICEEFDTKGVHIFTDNIRNRFYTNSTLGEE